MWRVDDCFIHGCVFVILDVSIGCRYGFLTFPCLWEISFSSQMISGTVSWLLGLDTTYK